MSTTGSQIANSELIRSYMDSIANSTRMIDTYRAQITRNTDLIGQFEGQIADLTIQLSTLMQEYADMLQGVIDTGANATEVTDTELACGCGNRANGIRQNILALQSQIQYLTDNNASIETNITASEADIASTLALQIAETASIMAGNPPTPLPAKGNPLAEMKATMAAMAADRPKPAAMAKAASAKAAAKAKK
jgi:hypothetical protein